MLLKCLVPAPCLMISYLVLIGGVLLLLQPGSAGYYGRAAPLRSGGTGPGAFVPAGKLWGWWRGPVPGRAGAPQGPSMGRAGPGGRRWVQQGPSLRRSPRSPLGRGGKPGPSLRRSLWAFAAEERPVPAGGGGRGGGRGRGGRRAVRPSPCLPGDNGFFCLAA